MASSRMIALLGLLAVAGYQNRDKLGQLLGGITGQSGSGTGGAANGNARDGGGLGGLLGGLGGMLGGSSTGSVISGGLGDLLQQITGAGHGETANSWVKDGPNRTVQPGQLADALDADTLSELEAKTGLSRDEILSRLSAVLPNAVDKLTPEGRLPTEAEADQIFARR